MHESKTSSARGHEVVEFDATVEERVGVVERTCLDGGEVSFAVDETDIGFSGGDDGQCRRMARSLQALEGLRNAERRLGVSRGAVSGGL